jgi:hypothetical protein
LGACYYGTGYAVPVGDVPANTPTNLRGSFPIAWSSYGPDDPNQPLGFYTVMGLYQQQGGGQGVAVLYDSAIASAIVGASGIDTSWADTNLPGFTDAGTSDASFYSAPVHYTESQVATALAGSDMTTLEDLAKWYSQADFYTEVIGPGPGTDIANVSFLDFSNATLGGSGTALVEKSVPEPTSAFVLLGSGLWLTSARLRRRRA